jgi:hypothetical protein
MNKYVLGNIFRPISPVIQVPGGASDSSLAAALSGVSKALSSISPRSRATARPARAICCDFPWTLKTLDELYLDLTRPSAIAA